MYTFYATHNRALAGLIIDQSEYPEELSFIQRHVNF